MKRILIVDDHPIVRRGLADLVNGEPDFEVCGQAADANEAIECVRLERPDVIICDLTLNGTHGLDLIKRLRSSDPDIKVLVSSMHDELVYAERVLKAGGMGYINKQETVDKLIDAIHAVLAGNVFLSDKMTERLLRRRVGNASDVGDSPVDALTDRELEVFRLFGEGQTTKQVADYLKLSVKTIESHRENIKGKLGLANATELTRRAVEYVLNEQS
ncbi:MAG: response regulator transcription factor [Planctomycetaceae bacterium]|nr:response regulator transcription factor [Planctomycetales bacterium]MCB9875710.1 response regulator transcription factor [Planctomycetaceae bacterium]